MQSKQSNMEYTIKFPEQVSTDDYWDYVIKEGKLYLIFEFHGDMKQTIFVCDTNKTMVDSINQIDRTIKVVI